MILPKKPGWWWRGCVHCDTDVRPVEVYGKPNELHWADRYGGSSVEDDGLWIEEIPKPKVKT